MTIPLKNLNFWKKIPLKEKPAWRRQVKKETESKSIGFDVVKNVVKRHIASGNGRHEEFLPSDFAFGYFEK